jgi:hypothetical protein
MAIPTAAAAAFEVGEGGIALGEAGLPIAKRLGSLGEQSIASFLPKSVTDRVPLLHSVKVSSVVNDPTISSLPVTKAQVTAHVNNLANSVAGSVSQSVQNYGHAQLNTLHDTINHHLSNLFGHLHSQVAKSGGTQ